MTALNFGPKVSSKEGDRAQMNSITSLLQMWQRFLLGKELPSYHQGPTQTVNTVELPSLLCLTKAHHFPKFFISRKVSWIFGCGSWRLMWSYVAAEELMLSCDSWKLVTSVPNKAPETIEEPRITIQVVGVTSNWYSHLDYTSCSNLSFSNLQCWWLVVVLWV